MPQPLQGMHKTKTTLQTTLAADESLESKQFEIDAKGNVIVKNKALADSLAKSIKDSIRDPNINAISVGIVVDW